MDGVWNSRRSTVYSTKGIVSSTQPLANSAGIKILEKGGNAVDACVAVAAALTVTEPMSTGIGGDCFALFYSDKDKKVYGLNGTGRAASNLSIDWLKENHPDHILPSLRFRPDSVFKVNVPGAIAGWSDALEKWGSGKVTLSDCLQPAIQLTENGFGLSQCAAHMWNNLTPKLLRENEKNEDLKLFLPNESFTAPRKGQFVQNKKFAETLKTVAKEGKRGFYEGEVAEAIVKELNKRGHPITLKDLASHTSTFVEPLSYEFLDHKLWEIPPNGSGIIALLTLGLIKSLDKSKVIDVQKLKHNSTEYLHLLIECLKISFKDSDECVNDYEFFKKKYGVDFQEDAKTLLSSEDYFDERCKEFSPSKVISNNDLKTGIPNSMFKSDTVYFTVSDSEGNACSFINSLYEGFGSGIIIPDHGFVLQNRGGNFNLNPKSKNCLEGNKRSYHTIIPGMITEDSKLHEGKENLYASYGIMGGYNQPQAHVQVYLNMLLFGMDPQEALTVPRLCLFTNPDAKESDRGVGADGPASNNITGVGLENDFPETVVEDLKKLGHHVKVISGNGRNLFGRGQIIRKESKEDDGVLLYAGGSDPRGDGASVPFY